jgi:hypothetical protein
MAAVTVMDTFQASSAVMAAAHPPLIVKDASHSSQLASGLAALWEAGELCDYVIRGTDESFSIHSPVLAAQSPVFKSMLTSNMKESVKRNGVCTFPEISDAIMKKVLQAAYTGTCDIAREDVVPLIAAAHYLGMSTLLKACEELIPTLLCPSNCFTWTRIAKTFELDALVPRIQKRMRTFHEEVVQSDEFSEAEVVEVCEYLRDLVQHDIHSDVALAAALQWIERDPKSRAVHMPELFLSASVGDCTRSFLHQVMREKSDVIGLQQNNAMHKLILEQILDTDRTKLLILGGQVEACGAFPEANNDCWVLKDDQLVKFAEGPGEELRLFHSMCQVPQGVMLTGGESSKICKLFDVAKRTWMDKASLLTARYSHGSGYLNGNVFVIGGRVGGNYLSYSVDYLDLAENTWQHGPDLPETATYPKVAICNSKLYVLMREGRLYCLDRASKAWTAKSPLPDDDADWCSMTTVDDRMFVAGGNQNNQNINYMYLANADTWCLLSCPSLMDDYYGPLVYYRKKLYLITGCESNTARTAVMEYDIGSDTWAMSPWKLPKTLLRHAAFVVNVRL